MLVSWQRNEHVSRICRLPGCLLIYQADFTLKIEAVKENAQKRNQSSTYNERRKNNSGRDTRFFIMEIMGRKAENNIEKKKTQMCSLSTSHPQPWVINKGGIISLQGLSHQLCKHAIHSPTLRKASFSPPTPNPISQPLFLGKKKNLKRVPHCPPFLLWPYSIRLGYFISSGKHQLPPRCKT